MPRYFLAKSGLLDALLDSTAGGRPKFLTTQWELLVAASSEGAAEARAAMEEVYCLYCYPVYAFIRRRGHGRYDAQDLTQDFFVHLLEKGILGQADPQRGRFRNFLLGSLDHFLAHAAERAGAGKRGGGCQWVSLDDDAAEESLPACGAGWDDSRETLRGAVGRRAGRSNACAVALRNGIGGQGEPFRSAQRFFAGPGRLFLPASRQCVEFESRGAKNGHPPPAWPLSGRYYAKKWRAQSPRPRRSTRNFATFGLR